MARNADIGGYFDRLTRRGRGGRRLDDDAASESTETETSLGDASEPTSEASSGEPQSSGGIKDMLRDALGKSRRTAERTAERVKQTAKRRARPTTRRPRSRELPPEGVVHVEYTPREDGDPDPGEVVWTWVPFEEDPSQGKDRPVVIIGRRGSKLVGVPLTTKSNDREAQVNLGTGGWDPKRRVSYARIWRMLDVDADTTRREGATLDLERFEQLIAAVDHYYEIVLPTAPASTTANDYDY